MTIAFSTKLVDIGDPNRKCAYDFDIKIPEHPISEDRARQEECIHVDEQGVPRAPQDED